MSFFFFSSLSLPSSFPSSLLTWVALREEGKEELHHVRVLVLLRRPVAVQNDGHLREGGSAGGREGGMEGLSVLVKMIKGFERRCKRGKKGTD